MASNPRFFGEVATVGEGYAGNQPIEAHEAKHRLWVDAEAEDPAA
jgi:hypothetical protein